MRTLGFPPAGSRPSVSAPQPAQPPSKRTSASPCWLFPEQPGAVGRRDFAAVQKWAGLRGRQVRSPWGLRPGSGRAADIARCVEDCGGDRLEGVAQSRLHGAGGDLVRGPQRQPHAGAHRRVRSASLLLAATLFWVFITQFSGHCAMRNEWWRPPRGTAAGRGPAGARCSGGSSAAGCCS